jgi:hypothetical protein
MALSVIPKQAHKFKEACGIRFEKVLEKGDFKSSKSRE